MMKKNILLMLVPLLLVIAARAEAGVVLNVLPVDGGNNLRFGRIDTRTTAVDKEVRIRITSTDNNQYQVYQRIVRPLMNERGETLNRSGLWVSALPGSNTAGSLYVQNLEQLTFSDQLLYTSTTQGTSDGFTLFYKAQPEDMNVTGNLSGQILYSVRPIGGSRQDEVVLNVFLDIPNDFKVQTKTAFGKDRLRLQSDRPLDQGDYLELSIDGNLNKDLKIYQEIIEYPINHEGEELDPKAVEFLVAGNFAGETKFSAPANLRRGRDMVYTSSAEKDKMTLQFRLAQNTLDALKAGDYQGRIRYSIENGTASETFETSLEVSIKPVFKLVVDYPPGGVSFPKLLADSPPQGREVTVTVKTNLGKPYVVHQNISNLLTNEHGEEIPQDFFTMKQEMIGSSSGRIQSPDFSPVKSGDTPVYYSDKQGTPTEFKVIYRQIPYKEMKPGNYQTAIIYSLEQI